MSFVIEKIATVFNDADNRCDENWNDIISTIALDDKYSEETLSGLENFSHVEILYGFHRISKDEISTSKRSPRNNPQYPLTGIFSQRASKRPNLLGISIVKIKKVSNRSLIVSGLDAVNGSPVYDIKPVIREFLPEKSEIIQPEWASDIMKNYF